jgi:hypothetical protein
MRNEPPPLPPEIKSALEAYPRIVPSPDFEARVLEAVFAPRRITFIDRLDQLFARPAIKLIAATSMGLLASWLIALPCLGPQTLTLGYPTWVDATPSAGIATAKIAVIPPLGTGEARGKPTTLLALEELHDWSGENPAVSPPSAPPAQFHRRESAWPHVTARLS